MRTENLLCPDRSACNSQADPLAAHNAAYEQHLTDGGYAAGYAKCCKGGVAHLSRWMGFTHKKVSEVSEALIAEFLDIHLPRCACGSVIHDRGSLNGALGHLLVALRATGVIPPRAVDRTPIDEELQCYDQYMVEVRNLAPSTRKDALRIVRCLLHSRFGDGCIDFTVGHTEFIFLRVCRRRRARRGVVDERAAPDSGGVTVGELGGRGAAVQPTPESLPPGPLSAPELGRTGDGAPGTVASDPGA